MVSLGVDKIGDVMSRSALVDIATVAVLGLNLFVFTQALAPDMLLQISTEFNIIAAQLTAVMIPVYLLETLADRSGGSGDFDF